LLTSMSLRPSVFVPAPHSEVVRTTLCTVECPKSASESNGLIPTLTSRCRRLSQGPLKIAAEVTATPPTKGVTFTGGVGYSLNHGRSVSAKVKSNGDVSMHLLLAPTENRAPYAFSLTAVPQYQEYNYANASWFLSCGFNWDWQ
jgi:hypothetical protein